MEPVYCSITRWSSVWARIRATGPPVTRQPAVGAFLKQGKAVLALCVSAWAERESGSEKPPGARFGLDWVSAPTGLPKSTDSFKIDKESKAALTKVHARRA